MQTRLNILLVEDDDQDAAVIHEMLNFPDVGAFNLLVHTRLAEALKSVDSDSIDIILTDLNLPDSTGLDSLTSLQEAKPELPIVVLTGLNDEDTGKSAVQCGAQDYLVKSEIQGESLKRCLSYAIERKKEKGKLMASEAKYKNLSSRLQEANTMKELLLDIITHDLKNNVSSISGLSDILQQCDPGNEIVEGIKGASDKLCKVIDNVTTLAKISIGDEIEKINMDLGKVIGEVIDEYSGMIESSEMVLEYRCACSETIFANPIIAEVFKNYISNAIKYASDGRKIIIDAETDNLKMLVRVSDLGELIPASEREIIFERKTQLNGKRGHGSGLGLAIVKRIAEMHGGKVWVMPYKSCGNSFCIELPMN